MLLPIRLEGIPAPHMERVDEIPQSIHPKSHKHPQGSQHSLLVCLFVLFSLVVFVAKGGGEILHTLPQIFYELNECD